MTLASTQPSIPRPLPPEPGDCCGNDCLLCVYSLYERELERWQDQMDVIATENSRPFQITAADRTR